MKFEDMQVIWDSQEERPMYQIDEQALYSIVQKQGRVIANMVGCFEIIITLAMVFLTVMLLVEPIFDQKEYYQLPQALLKVGIGVFIWRGRQKRLKTEAQFDITMLGMIDRSIYQLDYKIGLLKSYPWWFFAPVALGVIITIPFVYQGKPLWLWPAMVIAMGVVHLPAFRELSKLRSGREDLAILRQKLADANH